MNNRILRTETGSQVLRVKSVPAHVQTEVPHAGGFQITPIAGTVKAGATVILPASEVRMGAFYTFECEENGQLFRWIGQPARILTDDNFVVFNLPAIDPVAGRP
jgi:hypothetical protein